MLTGELKNRIDGLWDVFYTGGLTNPLDVIEQITYLMFIHDLDDIDNANEKDSLWLGLPNQSIFEGDNHNFKWSVFRDFEPKKMYDIVQNGVFPFIKNLHSDENSAYSKYMGDAIFKIPTPQKFAQVVSTLDDIYSSMQKGEDSDTKGDIYEYLLSKISTAGTNGQFRTPRHIIDMMVQLIEPNPNDTICDPACGTGGFLVSCAEYVKSHYKDFQYNADQLHHYNNDMFHGFDMDRTMLRIGAMNMMTHGIQNPNIEYKDSLSDGNKDVEKYTKIFANPPFKGSLDYDIVAPDLLTTCKTKKTELLFLALFLRTLKVGGRCACIVPDGVLFGSSNAHKSIRKELVENHRLEGVVSMPSGVFKPYAGVSTAVLMFTKTGHGGTDSVWFYDMQADGFSLDDKRSAVAENDIPDIVERFHNLEGEKSRSRTDKSFLVPKCEIVSNEYDLSINKYKKVEYVAENFPEPCEILAEIDSLMDSLSTGLAELRGLV